MTFTANYPGDVTDTVGQILGPNTLDEYFRITRVLYDVASDKSAVKFELLRQIREGREERGRHVTGWSGQKLTESQKRAVIVYIRTGKVAPEFPPIYQEAIK